LCFSRIRLQSHSNKKQSSLLHIIKLYEFVNLEPTLLCLTHKYQTMLPSLSGKKQSSLLHIIKIYDNRPWKERKKKWYGWFKTIGHSRKAGRTPFNKTFYTDNLDILQTSPGRHLNYIIFISKRRSIYTCIGSCFVRTYYSNFLSDKWASVFSLKLSLKMHKITAKKF